MESFMRRLAEKEKEREEQGADSDEERRRRAEPLLKATAFDRRKVVAVYTQDGRRGHHMQDFLPPEELAKFVKTPQPGTGGAAAAAAAAAGPPPPGAGLGAGNIGHKLLAKMGWKEGQGVGKAGGAPAAVPAPALAAPPPPVTTGAGGLGLGAAPATAVEEGDDEYTKYRKRMQTAYLYRPNPMGNPRKKYW